MVLKQADDFFHIISFFKKEKVWFLKLRYCVCVCVCVCVCCVWVCIGMSVSVYWCVHSVCMCVRACELVCG